MRLQELLNKFTNTDFMITCNDWCDELPFSEYSNERQQDYWKNYKDKKIKNLAIITTNESPELLITLE